MVERINAATLLKRAREVYDSTVNGLCQLSAGAWRTAFASGGDWMQQALAHLRQAPLIGTRRSLNRLGHLKYGLACAAALLFVVLAYFLEQPWILIFCVPAFYAVEAQMVFLFPLALDGYEEPFRASLLWTQKAGGTLAVMAVVLPIAGTMLFGGFVGRGFVRSWCLGCLAICVWYEQLRLQNESPTAPFFECQNQRWQAHLDR